MRVYHRKSLDSVWPRGYQLVARVFADSLEEAFKLTNSIDSPWWKNPRVIPYPMLLHRSTSIGDVIVFDDGTAMRCDSIGWEEVGE